MVETHESIEEIDVLLEKARQSLRSFEDGVDYRRLLLRLRTASPAHPVLLLRYLFGFGAALCVLAGVVIMVVPLVNADLARTLAKFESVMPYVPDGVPALPAVFGLLATCGIVGWAMCTGAALAIGREAQMLPWEQRQHQGLVNEVTRLTTQKAVMARIRNTPVSSRPRIASPGPVALRSRGPGSGYTPAGGGGFARTPTPAYMPRSIDDMRPPPEAPMAPSSMSRAPGASPNGGFGRSMYGAPAPRETPAPMLRRAPPPPAPPAHDDAFLAPAADPSVTDYSDGTVPELGAPPPAGGPTGPAGTPVFGGGRGFAPMPAADPLDAPSPHAAARRPESRATPSRYNSLGPSASPGNPPEPRGIPRRDAPEALEAYRADHEPTALAGASPAAAQSRDRNPAEELFEGQGTEEPAVGGPPPSPTAPAPSEFAAPPPPPVPPTELQTVIPERDLVGVAQDDVETAHLKAPDLSAVQGGVRLGGGHREDDPTVRRPVPDRSAGRSASRPADPTATMPPPAPAAPTPAAVPPLVAEVSFDDAPDDNGAADPVLEMEPGPPTNPPHYASRGTSASPENGLPGPENNGILSRARSGEHMTRATPYGSAGRIRPNSARPLHSPGPSTPHLAAAEAAPDLKKSIFGTPPPLVRKSEPSPTTLTGEVTILDEDEDDAPTVLSDMPSLAEPRPRAVAQQLEASTPGWESIPDQWLKDAVRKATELGRNFPVQAQIAYSREPNLPFTLVINRATPAMAVRAMVNFVEFLAGIYTPPRARIELHGVAHLDKSFHRNVEAALEPYFANNVIVEPNRGQVDIRFTDPDPGWGQYPTLPMR